MADDVGGLATNKKRASCGQSGGLDVTVVEWLWWWRYGGDGLREVPAGEIQQLPNSPGPVLEEFPDLGDVFSLDGLVNKGLPDDVIQAF